MSRVQALARGLAPGIAGRFARGRSLASALDIAVELRERGLRVDIERTPPGLDGSADDPSWRAYRDSALPEASEALTVMERAGFAVAGGVTIAAEPVAALIPTFAQWPSSATSGRAALRVVAEQAQEAGIPLTLSDGASVAALVELAREFRDDGLPVALTVTAARRRAVADCTSYDGPIRVVSGHRGSSDGSAGERFRASLEVDKSFIRCVKARLSTGLPLSVATHDARLVDIIRAVANRLRCPPGSVEYVLGLGRSPRLQHRLVAEGEVVRIVVPYGSPWLDGLHGVDGVVTAVQAAFVRPAGLIPGNRKEG